MLQNTTTDKYIFPSIIAPNKEGLNNNLSSNAPIRSISTDLYEEINDDVHMSKKYEEISDASQNKYESLDIVPLSNTNFIYYNGTTKQSKTDMEKNKSNFFSNRKRLLIFSAVLFAVVIVVLFVVIMVVLATASKKK